MKRLIINGLKILNQKHWLNDQAVIIEEGIIKAIIPASMTKHHLPAKIHHFPEDYYLTPGFIDLHIHGAAKHDVMDGSIEALTTISRHLAYEGVTGFLATTMTASNEQLEAALTPIPLAIQEPEGAAILGVHLEGPFIAAEKIGAQNARHIRAPDITLIENLQKIVKGAIKLVTLAPELPDALAFIQQLDKMNIIASIGHTNATYEETEEGIKAGCKYTTHLFNAMSGIHQRAPGATGALLLSEQVTAELIVDGIHLHPAIVDLALRCKKKENLVLVSDAMRAKCLGEGKFKLGSHTVIVERGEARLPDGTLAGSTLRIPEAIQKIQQYTNCSLIDAVSMASYNPARILGLHNRKGSIEIGKDADLVVLDAKFEPVLTLRNGIVIFER